MPKYKWTIKTADRYQGGTDADVTLALVGTLAQLKPTQITDGNSRNNFERNDVNSGAIEVAELGEIRSGKLTEDKSLGGSSWAVDWIRIENEDDQRIWFCNLNGAFSEDDGRNGTFNLVFTQESRGRFDEIIAQRRQELLDKEAAEQVTATKQAEDAAKRAREEQDKTAKRLQEDKDKAQQRLREDEEAELRRQTAKLDAELKLAAAQAELDLRKAEQEASIAEKRRKIEELKAKTAGSAPTPAGTPNTSAVTRTYEIYGVVNGVPVPYAQALAVTQTDMYGRPVARAGKLVLGDLPTDGFKLAGTPGAWARYFPSVSPAQFGLDADKGVLAWNGSSAEVVSAQSLAQILGPSWRAQVFS